MRITPASDPAASGNAQWGLVCNHDSDDFLIQFASTDTAGGTRFVAPTEEQALMDVKTSLNWTIDMLQWRGTFSEGSEVLHRLDYWRRERTTLPPSLEYIRENRSVIGSPEQCVAQIKGLQEQGIEYFGCNFAFGGMNHAKVMRSMELFASEVMPHFGS